MTFDPTKNEKPLGLLTEEEQRIMREWPHGCEWYSTDGWVICRYPVRDKFLSYRAKPPTMPEKLTRWINVFPNGFGADYDSEYELNRYGKDHYRIAVLRIEITGDKVEAFVEPTK